MLLYILVSLHIHQSYSETLVPNAVAVTVRPYEARYLLRSYKLTGTNQSVHA